MSARDVPSIAPLPTKQTDYITFGCFNSLQKITPEVMSLWGRILKALPEARLIVKNKSMVDESTRERFATLLMEQGVARERIELIGWLPTRHEHMGLYGRIDIALDTFPYNGTTTTCEALWMGVPVVVLEGNRHAARVGVSLLTHVDLTEMIAGSPEDYVRIAIALAGDPGKLAALRNGLREQLARSPLCDGATFTRDLETAYREMWVKWCVTAGRSDTT